MLDTYKRVKNFLANNWDLTAIVFLIGLAGYVIYNLINLTDKHHSVYVQYSDQGQVVRCWVDYNPWLKDHVADHVASSVAQIQDTKKFLGVDPSMKCFGE